MGVWEKSFLYWLVNHRIRGLNCFFLSLTYLGNAGIILVIFLFFLYFFRKKSFFFGFTSFMIALVFSEIFVHLGKHFVHRVRPVKIFPEIQVLGPLLKYASFPSGHSAVAFTGAVLFSHFFPRYTWLFYLFAFLVAFSRLYLGVHFPSDVLAGGIIGYFNGKISLWVNRKWRKTYEERSN